MRIFTDTETTGLKEPALVELAMQLEDGPLIVVRCRPTKPIEEGATEVNGITNEMVADFPLFRDIPEYDMIKEALEKGVVVAHNAIFDIGVLAREGIHVKRYVDTKEMARSVLPGHPSYRLQDLRSALLLNIDAVAHSAAGDVAVLQALWNRMIEGRDPERAVDRFSRYLGAPNRSSRREALRAIRKSKRQSPRRVPQ